MDSGHLVRGTASTIREVSPAGSFEYGTPPPQPWLPSQESALREYFRVLIKRKWTVIGCLAIIFSIVAIASFKMVPIYDAVGHIAINNPDNNLVNFKDAPGSADYSDPTDLDTEVKSGDTISILPSIAGGVVNKIPSLAKEGKGVVRSTSKKFCAVC